jgi:hypothetical protein
VVSCVRVRTNLGRRCSETGQRGPAGKCPDCGESRACQRRGRGRGNWHDPCVGRINNACESESAVKFAIEVGDTEKHRLEYNFNQLMGSLVIKVNDKPIKKSVRLINEPVLEIHAFVVGNHEKSSVRIEKERKQLLGCKNRLYVNNRLVKVFKGI